MFCRNCGKGLNESAEICTGCGVKLPTGNKFCHACGAPTDPLAEFCIKCGARLSKAQPTVIRDPNVSPKSRLVCTLLAFFLGTLGAHRFYLGKTGTAVTMLVLGIAGWVLTFVVVGVPIVIAVGIWALIDFILAVSGKMRDKEGKIITDWQT